MPINVAPVSAGPVTGGAPDSISVEWANSRNTERTTHSIPSESDRRVVGTASKRNRSVGFTDGEDNRFRCVVVDADVATEIVLGSFPAIGQKCAGIGARKRSGASASYGAGVRRLATAIVRCSGICVSPRNRIAIARKLQIRRVIHPLIDLKHGLILTAKFDVQTIHKLIWTGGDNVARSCKSDCVN